MGNQGRHSHPFKLEEKTGPPDMPSFQVLPKVMGLINGTKDPWLGPRSESAYYEYQCVHMGIISGNRGSGHPSHTDILQVWSRPPPVWAPPLGLTPPSFTIRSPPLERKSQKLCTFKVLFVHMSRTSPQMVHSKPPSEKGTFGPLKDPKC